jgi:hypothetical protein
MVHGHAKERRLSLYVAQHGVSFIAYIQTALITMCRIPGMA